MKTSLFILFLIASSYCFSQETSKTIIVRLNHKLVDWGIIDDNSIVSGNLIEFLSDVGKHELETLNNLEFDLATIKATKIFPNLYTGDSISIGRQGNVVYMPPFWATFTFQVPNELKYHDFLRCIKSLYPIVIYAHPQFEFEFDDVPDDELFSDQFSLNSDSVPAGNINVEQAWDIETGKRHIKVGIFDTGVDSTHEEINLLTGYGYYNLIASAAPWGVDNWGHGTPVAGIIGATRNDSIGIAGIAGGDGSDTSGVSLIDFHYGDGSIADAEFFSAGIISAARSPGSYYTGFTPNFLPTGFGYYDSMPGYGIHIGNHSYGLRLTADVGHHTDGPTIDDTIGFPGDGTGSEWGECNLCRESFLFSLQNGVLSVASRGNIVNSLSSTLGQYSDPPKLPAAYPDSWVMAIGASGTDGNRLIGGQNTGSYTFNWFSPQTRLDLIAPGTKALVVSTKSSQSDSTQQNQYRRFNGTSAAAPHVSGVAALLLSKYNKNCYSEMNLDPADVEYILEHSATDVDSIGPDINSGHGLLNAKAAMDMIDFPNLQVIHPHDSILSISLILEDTINVHLDNTLYNFMDGPLGSSYPLQNAKDYRVVKQEYEIEYYFGDYILPTTTLLDAWVRHSRTNSLTSFIDTTAEIVQGTPILLTIDTFNIEPMCEIISFTNTTITLRGNYYHFIGKYDFSVQTPLQSPQNFWYPINPNEDTPKMAYSIYIQDSTLAERYDFICDSANILLDSLIPFLDIEEHGFEDFSVFPNPTNSELNVKFENVHSNGRLRLLDLTGKVILEEEIKIGVNNYLLDIKTLRSGMYLLTIDSTEGQVGSKKIIKL